MGGHYNAGVIAAFRPHRRPTSPPPSPLPRPTVTPEQEMILLDFLLRRAEVSGALEGQGPTRLSGQLGPAPIELQLLRQQSQWGQQTAQAAVQIVGLAGGLALNSLLQLDERARSACIQGSDLQLNKAKLADGSRHWQLNLGPRELEVQSKTLGPAQALQFCQDHGPPALLEQVKQHPGQFCSLSWGKLQDQPLWLAQFWTQPQGQLADFSTAYHWGSQSGWVDSSYQASRSLEAGGLGGGAAPLRSSEAGGYRHQGHLGPFPLEIHEWRQISEEVPEGAQGPPRR